MPKYIAIIFIKMNRIFALDKWEFKKEKESKLKTWQLGNVQNVRDLLKLINGNRFVLFFKVSPSSKQYIVLKKKYHIWNSWFKGKDKNFYNLM